jgi:DNA repair protein RadC
LSCPKPPSINTTSGKKARRTALLNHFGGLQELKQASVEEMQKVYDKIPSTKYTNEVTTKVAAITWASLRFLPSSLLFIFQTT